MPETKTIVTAHLTKADEFTINALLLAYENSKSSVPLVRTRGYILESKVGIVEVAVE